VNYDIEFVHMPLAVYREVAAHLRMAPGVQAELLPQTAQTFDYLQSQVGGVRISAIHEQDESQQAAWSRVIQILAYYHDRYPLHDPTVLSRIEATLREQPQAMAADTPKSEVTA
jgi:hypothetical protein